MLLDPAGAFADPEKVLGHDVLTREQKIRVLKLVGDAGIMHTDPSKQHSLI